MSDIITNPRRFGLDRHVKIPRSRVRVMLEHLGASMSRDTTRPSAAKFGATFGPGREGADATLDRLQSTTSPLALAVEQHRAAMLEARRLSAHADSGDLVCDAEEAFRDAARSAFPLDRPDDALAAVEWLLTDLREETAGPNMTESDEIRIELLSEAARVVGRMAAEAAGRLGTSIIPELDMTFGDAAERYRAGRRYEMETLPGPLADTPDVEHPDRALLEAWDGFVQAHRTLQHARDVLLPNGGTDAEHEPYWKAVDTYADRIVEHRASTVEGFAVQLRYLFAAYMEDADADRAAFFSEPLTEDLTIALSEDYRPRVLWRMAQAATQASLSRTAGSPAEEADAELIDAATRWFTMRNQLDDGFGEDRDPTEAEQVEWGQLHSRISALPCSTAAGALAKVAVLTSHMVGGIAALDDGQPLAPLLRSIEATTAPEPVATITRHLAQHIKEINEGKDCAERTIDSLWQHASCLKTPDLEVLALLRKMTAEQRREFIAAGRAELAAVESERGVAATNPFADAVTAFEAEAPATLSVPQQPTGSMVEAAATAAGITPEQFHAAYAAAVEALKKERAA